MSFTICTSSTHSSSVTMSGRSLLGTLKHKLSRKGSSSSSQTRSASEKRPSRVDSRGHDNTMSSHWNPFADPSSTQRKLADGTQQLLASIANVESSATDDPPSYTAAVDSKTPSASSGFLSATPDRRGVSPVPSLASVTSAEDKYAFLSTFDTIFVIDDSGSMAGRSWREVRDALQAITPICTDHDADGIDVFFLNHKSRASNGGYCNIRDTAQVQHLFESVRPSGATPTGASLHRILKPYVASLARCPDQMETIKPINIIVITDGCPTDDPESIIAHHARKLDTIDAPPYQVGIQFFQVGSEPSATRALRELDDDLAEQGIRDMVDTVTWDASSKSSSRELTADGILKVVLGAVVRRLDRKSTSGATRDRSH